jgi:hypothetical protein
MARKFENGNHKHTRASARRPALRNGDRRSSRQQVQCGICLRSLSERHFGPLYVTEIPGYPLGAALRTWARVLICRNCWNGVVGQDSDASPRLRKLFRMTGGASSRTAS